MSAVTVQIWIDNGTERAQQMIEFTGDDDLDCPYLGFVRVVPADGYIDIPVELVKRSS